MAAAAAASPSARAGRDPANMMQPTHGSGGGSGEGGGPVLPSAAEYCRFGISVEGLELFLQRHAEDITVDTTTSDICHALIKPATVPAGWTDEAMQITVNEHGDDIRGRRWYRHSYREVASGQAQDEAPPGTRSYCELLLGDPATASMVGQPTLFLSHAWVFKFRNVVTALRHFVCRLPASSPPQFVWFDCFSIDEHATQCMPQDWWGSTFREAIALIGHTVMLLSPWDRPVPLTRAWCLWELYCTHQAEGASFSVCLGPEEQRAFKASLLDISALDSSEIYNPAVLDAFGSIDVANSEAGSEADRVMILGAVERAGGCSKLNALAFEKMRGWVFEELRQLAAAANGEGEAALQTKTQVARVFSSFDMDDEAEPLCREVLASTVLRFGNDHVQTITIKNRLANVISAMGGERETELQAEALSLYREVVAGRTKHYGGDHVETLTGKNNLANVLGDEGTETAMTEAEALYREVVAGRTAQYGAEHKETLSGKLNLANHIAETGVEEAKALLREVVSGFTTHYGSNHMFTLLSKASLADVLSEDEERTQKDMAEAEILAREVVEGYTVQCGVDHSKTLDAKECLACLLFDFDQMTPEMVAEATRLLREVVAWNEKAEGADDRSTLNAKMNLAQCLVQEATTDALHEAGFLFREGVTGLVAKDGQLEALADVEENWPEAFDFVDFKRPATDVTGGDKHGEQQSNEDDELELEPEPELEEGGNLEPEPEPEPSIEEGIPPESGLD
eukprot:COSAG05_NODE_784_length_7362_cov_36.913810_1_plen_741_part_00